MNWSSRSLYVLLLLALLCLQQSAHAAVMSIDYGTEWFKVGLVKPGVPMDVALNKDSKRKTQAIMTLRGNERLYGSDAAALSGRFPQFTYSNLKSIAGRLYDDQHCVEYRQRSVNNMIPDPRRNTPLFRHNGTEDISVEELIAYQFQNARKQAIATAGEDVKDVVITVTPFATQYERQAILDAAQLAGLNVLALIHDETAVALNYASHREFSSTPENHIFYDMGAGSTVASVVSFSTVDAKEGKITRKMTQLEVKAVGYDRTLGGHEFDVRLQGFLAEKFMEKHGKSVKSDIRQSDSAMTRLLKEANRVKQILSANTETTSSIESLHEDIDFRVLVTRAEFEDLCRDLFARVQRPILTALKASNMDVSDIKSLILVGGSVRIPEVQRNLVSIVGQQKIAKNVNGDEAAVLGAVFRAASLSNQFRLTKQIKIKDVTVYPIEVTYTPDTHEEQKPIKTTLFNEFGTIGTRKIMTFKRSTDFEFELTYGEPATSTEKVDTRQIAKVKVTGLTAALEKFQEDIKASEQPPKVRVAIELSNSGILSVPEASVSIGVKESGRTFTEKVKSFFGSKEESEGKKEQQEQNNTETETSKETGEESTQPKEATVNKIPLTVEFIHTGLSPLSNEEKKIAQERIKKLDTLDEERRLWEEARNTLEAFVYRTQEFLYDDIVAIVSTEEEQEKLREHLSVTSDWLYDEGETADTTTYVQRLEHLKSLEQPIVFRRNEYSRRDENIKSIETSIMMARVFLSKIESDTPEEVRYHTKEELEHLSNLIQSTEQWKTEKVNAQKALAAHVDPVLTTAEVEKKRNQLDEVVMKLLSKKKPKVVKKEAPKNETETEEPPKNEERSEGSEPQHDEL